MVDIFLYIFFFCSPQSLGIWHVAFRFAVESSKGIIDPVFYLKKFFFLQHEVSRNWHITAKTWG